MTVSLCSFELYFFFIFFYFILFYFIFFVLFECHKHDNTTFSDCDKQYNDDNDQKQINLAKILTLTQSYTCNDHFRSFNQIFFETQSKITN